MTDLTVEHSITAVDARALARIHRAAFPGFFLAQLGEPFLMQFYLGFVADPTAVIAICRDASRRPLGVAVGTTEPQGFFGRLLRRRFWGFVGASALAALRNPAATPRLLRAVMYRGDNPPGRGGALLSSICVDPAHAGKGVGSTLVREWARRAQQMGAESAFLTTDAVGNDVVNVWYVREGWVLNDQFAAHGDRLMNRYEFDLRALDGAP